MSRLDKDPLPYDKLYKNYEVVSKRLGRKMTLSEKVLYSHLDNAQSQVSIFEVYFYFEKNSLPFDRQSSKVSSKLRFTFPQRFLMSTLLARLGVLYFDVFLIVKRPCIFYTKLNVYIGYVCTGLHNLNYMLCF